MLSPRPLFNQVVSIYIVDDCLYHISKGGKERGEWELHVPCYIVSSLSGIKKAEEGKHQHIKGTNLNANA